MNRINTILNIILWSFVVLFVNEARSQVITDSCINMPYLNFAYTFQVPFGDQTEWFGVNHAVGAEISYKTKHNDVLSLQWDFIFGDKVKKRDELLKYVTNSYGKIINLHGQEAIVNLYERGHAVILRYGKIVRGKAKNPNSGWLFSGGVGVLTHKIRIEVYENDVPPLNDDYKKGYDRLSIGPVVDFQPGYLYFGRRNLVYFSATLDLRYGLLKNVRPYNFDEMAADKELKHEFYVGVKVGWVFPLYKKAPRDFYYY